MRERLGSGKGERMWTSLAQREFLAAIEKGDKCIAEVVREMNLTERQVYQWRRNRAVRKVMRRLQRQMRWQRDLDLLRAGAFAASVLAAETFKEGKKKTKMNRRYLMDAIKLGREAERETKGGEKREGKRLVHPSVEGGERLLEEMEEGENPKRGLTRRHEGNTGMESGLG